MGWTVRGSNPVAARFSAPVQTEPGAHPASCIMGTGSFPGVKSGRGVTLTPHPLLVPWPWKGRAIPLLPLRPYGLYRASVPVQGWPFHNGDGGDEVWADLFRNDGRIMCCKVCYTSESAQCSRGRRWATGSLCGPVQRLLASHDTKSNQPFH